LQNLPLSLVFAITAIAGIIVALLSYFLLIPRYRKSIAVAAIIDPEADDEVQINKLFSFLQILSAIFGSFAHGGNDVANAISPLIAIWVICREGSVHQKSETPIYMLLYGGIGMAVGLWVFGRRVVMTIGKNLTKITPAT